MGPAIVVFPDCFTALGGNQYVNSSAIGDYADYLTREIVPFVDREFRTLASRDHRGCFGKSSGGYGAMLHGMRYASTWGAVADHSGDAYFEFVYWHDWPNTLNELAKYRRRRSRAGRFDVSKAERGADQGRDDGRVQRFLRAVWQKAQAVDVGSALHHEPVHGRDLRPRSAGAERLSAAGQPRDRREHRRALGALARARSRESRRQIPKQLEVAARHLHRLRLARPVSYPLWLAPPFQAAARGPRRSRLRGVRRQPLRHRLPNGCLACRSSIAR